VRVIERRQHLRLAFEPREPIRVSSERRRAIARWRIVELLRENLLARVLATDASVAMLNRLADEVATRQRDPYSAVEEIIEAAKS